MESVSRIVKDINDVNQSSAAIAAAVEQQGAATAEIARNVSQTKDAATEVATKISRVSADAAMTGQSAASVSVVTEEVAVAIQNLRESLIRTIRTASPETDRRVEKRFASGKKVTLGVADGTIDGVIIDISRKGIKIKTDSAAPPRATCTLTLDGLSVQAHFTEIRNGAWRFKFDATAEAKISELIKGYQTTTAARKAS